jgi:hypothetical protein
LLALAPYASLAYCGGLTVMLYDTVEEAVQGKPWLERYGCGHACRGERTAGLHVIVCLTDEGRHDRR